MYDYRLNSFVRFINVPRTYLTVRLDAANDARLQRFDQAPRGNVTTSASDGLGGRVYVRPTTW